MKKLYILLTLLVLASCGETEISSITISQTDAVQETSQEIAAAIDALGGEEKAKLQGPEGKPERKERGGKGGDPVPEAVYEGGKITDTEVAEGKVVELSTTYISPKTEVIMNISYTLDDQGAFSKIAVTSPNYTHMPKFNNGIQNIIGLTIDEAIGYNVAGSTLGSVAFSNVLKEL